MDLNLNELLDVGFDVLTADDIDVPPDLGDRVLTASLAQPRASMHADWDAGNDELTVLGALSRTAAELSALLDGLEPAEWTMPTKVQEDTVHGLVVHLVGVERYMLGQLGRRPEASAPTREEHSTVTRALAADMVGADSSRLARTWWLEVMELIGAIGEVGPDHAVSYHHLSSGARGMGVVRTFELWTHNEDIRRATDRGLSPLDEPRLALMSTSLLSSLGGGMALMGTAQPGRTARVHVTGAGPTTRTFNCALAYGETAGTPDLTVTVDALDLCRLASNRVAIADLDAEVDGDRSLLEPMLVGATAFAMD
jgi:uncharacterized protein (TIGR03083 family)